MILIATGGSYAKINIRRIIIQFWHSLGILYTVMIPSFRTDRSWQTVQIQIRLLLKEQSDLCLHRLLVLMKYPEVCPLFEF